MKLYGQENLETQFNNFTLDTLPHTIMLVGPLGSGKHTLVSNLSDRLHLEIKNLDTITNEVLSEIINSTVPTMCVIDGESISMKEESALLKFIEEPPAHIFITICCTSTNLILNTIKNRCQIFRFAPYTNQFLKSLYPDLNDKYLFAIADTPGKILAWQSMPLIEMFKLASDILNRIQIAKISNILKISDKINFSKKENTALFEFEPFLACLLYMASERCKRPSDVSAKTTFEQFKLTKQLIIDSHIPNIDKQKLFEHYLFELKIL